MRTILRLAVVVAFGAAIASAGTISYTCDPGVDAIVPGTCSYLNSAIAGLYNSTFGNANADFYVQYGTTNLGQSTTGYDNQVSYNAYRAALAATGSGSPADLEALASLPVTEPAIYNGADIDISSALGEALGFTGLNGTTASGSICTIGTAGCYNGVITVTFPADLLPQTLYYRNGPQDPNSYDFYGVVEHETNELLGTSSCIDTTGATLSDPCPSNAPSAADLFRYNAGNRVFIDTTPGAYFSNDGGVTQIGSYYNTLANGTDYADFVSNCSYIQDGTACLGGSFDITNDGPGGAAGPEAAILDAIGYNLNSQINSVPEPNTMALFGSGLILIAAYRRRHRLARIGSYARSQKIAGA